MRWKDCSELTSYQLENLFIEEELTKTWGGCNHDRIVFITAKEGKVEHRPIVIVTLGKYILQNV